MARTKAKLAEIFVALFLSLFIASMITTAAHCQTTSTVSGIVKDISAATVTSGKIVFTMKADSAIAGAARFAAGQPVQCKITASGVKAWDGVSACVITKTTSLMPRGLYYNVSMCPYNACTASFNMFAVNDSIDISTVVPTPGTSPVYGVVTDYADQTVGGNKTFSGTTTFSGNTTFTGSGTFSGSVIAKNINGTRYADQFAGADIGAKINAAYADLPSTGGTIVVQANSYELITPVVINTPNKPAEIKGTGKVTFFNYSPSSGSAFTLAVPHSMIRDIRLWTGAAGSTATGIQIGSVGTDNCQACAVENVLVEGFKVNLLTQSYNTRFFRVQADNCSSASGSIALQQTGAADDVYLDQGYFFGCSVLLSNVGAAGPMWISNTVMANALDTWVKANASIQCTNCHFYNKADGVPTKWFDITGGVAVFNNAHFETARSSGTEAACATVSSGVVQIAGATLQAYGGETCTTFVTASGSGALQLNGITNFSPSAIPAIYNAGWNRAYWFDDYGNGVFGNSIKIDGYGEFRKTAFAGVFQEYNGTTPSVLHSQYETRLGSGQVLSFSSSADPAGGGPDVGLSRISAGVMGVGDGTGFSSSGTLQLGRLNFGATGPTVVNGSASTRNAVRTAFPSVAIGSVYVSTAGKIYQKVANAGADTDWQRVTSTAVD